MAIRGFFVSGETEAPTGVRRWRDLARGLAHRRMGVPCRTAARPLPVENSACFAPEAQVAMMDSWRKHPREASEFMACQSLGVENTSTVSSAFRW